MRKFPAFAGVAVALAVLLSACTSAPAAPSAPVDQRVENSRSISLTGTVVGGSGSVSGTFSVGLLRDQAGTLLAVGTFTGTRSDGEGEVSGTSTIAIPVLPGALTGRSGSCTGLRLRLLPSDISLLGVTVHFDPAVIDIVSAPANLLGNLACQAAGLLHGVVDGAGRLVGGAANTLVSLLNQILGLLLDL